MANRLNRAFTWIYDDANRTVTQRTPRQQSGQPDAAKSTVTVRNTRGLVASVTEPSGQVTTFTMYDAEGRNRAKDVRS